MADLATVADAERLGYKGLTQPLLTRASARARRRLKQTISREITTETFYLTSCWFTPLQKPLNEVISISDPGGDVMPTSSWELQGHQIFFPSYLNPGKYSITYDHGLDVISDELIDVICGIAARFRGEDIAASKKKSERVDDYEVDFFQSDPSEVGTLLPSEEWDLKSMLGLNSGGAFAIYPGGYDV